MTPDDFMLGLRPDAVTEESHRRRRARDLAAAFATAERPRPPVPARLLKIALGLAAAAAIGVLYAMESSPAAPQAAQTVRPAVHDRATPAHLTDVRSFLLAGAETVARTPGTRARYWFSSTRVFDPVAGGGVLAVTDEVWRAPDGGRLVTGKDSAHIPPRPGAVLPEEKTVDHGPMIFQAAIGGTLVSDESVVDLPGDQQALDRWLRQAYRGVDRGLFAEAATAERVRSYPSFVLGAARYLLGSPATPATRAAVLRLLAAQLGLTMKQGVTDPMGRAGVEIGLPGDDTRLIIDPTGARLLSFAYDGPDVPEKRTGASVRMAEVSGRKVAILSSGWVDLLGARP
ncbi:hypothetical protein [Nonomuraea soli]|uniref:CU044_5270 family protein n=1 Tax=Nonomuraea soli TaxID=1032476 RepID=A0A7W0HST2_9ACTN|nr:hypothetical protein [Nonomuraea soli]MBA2894325.1 hypothetical protein [Nonomuraea soli]